MRKPPKAVINRNERRQLPQSVVDWAYSQEGTDAINRAIEKANAESERMAKSWEVPSEMLDRVFDAPIRWAEMQEKERFSRAPSTLKERIRTKE